MPKTFLARQVVHRLPHLFSQGSLVGQLFWQMDGGASSPPSFCASRTWTSPWLPNSAPSGTTPSATATPLPGSMWTRPRVAESPTVPSSAGCWTRPPGRRPLSKRFRLNTTVALRRGLGWLRPVMALAAFGLTLPPPTRTIHWRGLGYLSNSLKRPMPRSATLGTP